MGLYEVIIGFFVAIIILMIAWVIMPSVTNSLNRKFFFPALLSKMISAVLLGLLYNFYYKGGDTFTYFNHGAIHIYNAFWDDPIIAWNLIFGDTDYSNGVYKYASRIWMYNDPSSYFIVKIAGAVSVFVGGSYTATALIFSTISFSGVWAMYVHFTKIFKGKEKLLAYAILFIPSTIFFSSGILKDTVTFSFLNWVVASFIHIFYEKKNRLFWVLIMLISCIVITKIKMYIIMALLPSMIIWLYLLSLSTIKNMILRYLVAPFMIFFGIIISGYSIYLLGKDNNKYALDKLANTSKVTAYDVGRFSGKGAGSGYDLGDLDGTFLGMLKLAPSAINVSLFRPYLWEVKNPLMLLGALEGLFLLVISLFILIKSRLNLFIVINNPAITFCILFSLIFAFFVGASSYNFGTLFRYKVPFMPFYAIFLAMVWEKSNKPKEKSFKLNSPL